jgi:hypothetical protein
MGFNRMIVIYLGLGTELGPGNMSFDLYAHDNTNYMGALFYVNLINRSQSHDVTVPNSVSDTTGGNYWLDNVYPYRNKKWDMSVFHPPIPNPLDINFNDGPYFSGYCYSYVQMTDAFKTYLCFQPELSNSIPITIGSVDWGWNGKAQWQNNWWYLTSQGTSPPSLDVDDSFPTWSSVDRNSGN